ncbi:MAG TPA: hypothetical protein VEQ85_14495, partial [Lacipirellulaceae bacterium]|nr:hypothetical protein [Lacipirellulaceae bacterium]
MDTHDYPSLGRLAGLNAQLAVQSRRVESIVAAQLDVVERLFRAATKQDWPSVARASETLASQSVTPENETLVRSASQVCDALRRDPTGVKA